jgi:hypothetical protein
MRHDSTGMFMEPSAFLPVMMPPYRQPARSGKISPCLLAEIDPPHGFVRAILARYLSALP